MFLVSEQLVWTLRNQQPILLEPPNMSLEPLQEEHMQHIRQWRNEQIAILRQQLPLSEEDQKRYWKDTILPTTKQDNPSLILFAIIDRSGQQINQQTLIGYTGLTHIDWSNKRAEISFLLDTTISEETDLFQSLFFSCLKALTTLSFEKLHLEKIIAEVFAFRKEVIRCLKMASFEHDGTLRRHVHKKGKIYDSLLFSKQKKQLYDRAILITSLSQKTPLIHSLRNAMGALGEYFTLIGCDIDSSCLGKYSVDHFWTCPSWTDPGAQEKLLSFCKEHNVAAIIPTRDGELAFFAHLNQKLRNAHIALLTSSEDTIRLCQDKWMFMKILSQHHIPVIPSYRSLAELPTTHACYIVKERYSTSQKQLFSCSSKEEIRSLLSSFNAPLFQPKVEGTEYSIDVYRSRHTKETRALVRHRNVIIGSEAYLTTPIRHPRLEKYAIRAASILNIEGHAVFQAIETEQQESFFIECNPRVGGASTAAFSNGLESLDWFIQEELLKKELPPFQNKGPFFPQLRVKEDHLLV